MMIHDISSGPKTANLRDSNKGFFSKEEEKQEEYNTIEEHSIGGGAKSKKLRVHWCSSI